MYNRSLRPQSCLVEHQRKKGEYWLPEWQVIPWSCQKLRPYFGLLSFLSCKGL